jgi:hypothetical protein
MLHRICLQVNHPGVSIVLDKNVWPHTVTLAGHSTSSMRSAVAAARSAAYETGSSAAAVAWPSIVFALSTREKLLLDNIDGGRLLADLEALHRVTIMVRYMTQNSFVIHMHNHYSGVQLFSITYHQSDLTAWLRGANLMSTLNFGYSSPAVST